ncbi:bacterial Ig-like domain-containing protein [Listeria valentina]|uniref:bacterial Ig-like domain-containing protein n=1 Tax=Listeria valentina TaxID=2705293 RepID=UPI001430891D|nr:bacterial Ig-like domain-containing protein [Listeria valentina]
MTAKNWLKLLPILLIFGIGLFFIPHLFAENGQIDDLSLNPTEIHTTLDDLFVLTVNDKNQNDEKVFIPLPESIDYVSNKGADAAVTYDEQKRQLVIDRARSNQKAIQLYFKPVKKGKSLLKAYAIRSMKRIESKPVQVSITNEKKNSQKADDAFSKRSTPFIDFTKPYLYSIRTGVLQAFSEPDLLKGKITLSSQVPILSISNQIGFYNNKLYAFQILNVAFYLYEINGDGSWKRTPYPVMASVGGDISQRGIYTAISRGTQPNTYKLLLIDVNAQKIVGTKDIIFPTKEDADTFKMNGDLAYDGEGALWKVSYEDSNGIIGKQYLQKIDPQTGKLIKNLQIKNAPGSPVPRSGYSGMAFLSNGELVLGNNQAFYKVDMGTAIVSLIGSGVNTYDLASPFRPYLKTHLNISASANPASGASVYQRGEITYTYTVGNNGNLASSRSILTTVLPKGTTYVPNSTTLNNEKVADKAGTSPVFSGMEVASKGSLPGIISKDQPGKVSFKVKVKADAPPKSTVTSQAKLSAENAATVQSNPLTHTVLLNQSNLKVKNSTIKIGQIWKASDNFVSAKDLDGSAIPFGPKKIQVSGTVNTHKLGKYTVTYQNQDLKQKAIITVVRRPAPTAKFLLSVSDKMATKEDQRILLGDSLTLKYQLQNPTVDSGFRPGEAKWTIPLPIGVEPIKLSDLLTLTGPNGAIRQVPWNSLYVSKSRTITIDSQNFDPNWLKLAPNSTLTLSLNVKINPTDAAHIVGTKLSSTPVVTGTDYNGDKVTLKSPAPLAFGPIYSGALQFHDVPSTLAFQNGWIKNFTSEVSREDPNWKIIVEDTRRRSKNWNNNWQITAKQVSPFETKQKDILTNVLVFKRNTSSEQVISDKSSTIVFSGKSNAANFYDVLWAKNQGLFLKIPPGKAKANQAYQNVIEWNLSDAPL